jgi:hypothetical protein
MIAPAKSYAVFGLVFLTLFFLHADARAVSVEVRAGGGETNPLSEIATDIGDSASAGIVAADIVFSAWDKADLFVGAEYAKAGRREHSSMSSDVIPVVFSWDYTAMSFGIRLKTIMRDRWYSYIALGGLAGKVNYKADFSSGYNIVSPMSDRGSSYFAAPRVGVGAVIGLSKQLGVGIEAAVTPGLTGYKFDIDVMNSNTGQIENRTQKNRDSMAGITLGLQYTF